MADTDAYARKKQESSRRRILCLINSADLEALILPPAAEYREFISTENKYTESGAAQLSGCLTLRKNQLRGNASVDWYQR